MSKHKPAFYRIFLYLKRVFLFPLDLLYLTVDAWIIAYFYILRLLRREKDQRCHFCRGEDNSEPGHMVRSVLKYQNLWILKFLQSCLRVKSGSGAKPVVVCMREGGYTKASPLVPVLAVGLTFFWCGIVLGTLKAVSSEPEHFWSNFITFFNPAGAFGGDSDLDFLEGGEVWLNPDRAERYYLSGIRFFDRQEFARAQVDFKIAIQSNPGDAKLHYHLARSLFAVGQFVQGEASIRQTLQLEPDHADALLIMAEILERREDRAGALNQAKRALAQRPEHIPSVRMVLALSASLGDLDTARVLADQLIKLDSDSPATLAFLGRVELNAFRNAEIARGLFTSALEKDPDHVDALLGMIPLHAQDQDMPRIDQTLKRVLELQPDNIQANQLRAEMMLSRFGLGVGLREYQSLLNRFAGEMGLRLRYAELLLQAGRMSEGIRLSRQLAASRIPAVERSSHWMLAQSYAQLRLFEEAVEHARQALTLSPNNRNIQLFLGQTLLQNGKPAEAKMILENAVASNPEDAQAITLLSQAFVALGETGTAIQLLTQALDRNPEADILRLRRVEIQMQSPGWRQSISDARALYEKYPDRPELANNLAFMLARSGEELDFALSIAAPLREQFPDNPVIMDTYAFVLAARGEHEEAVALYNQALERAGGNPSIRFHLGQSLFHLGRHAEAGEQLQVVLILDPSFNQADEVRALLARIPGGTS